MALLSINTEDYTKLYELFRLPKAERANKSILTKHMDEVLRMHGVRSSTIFRSKADMLEAMDNTILISPFRSTLNSKAVDPASINAPEDLKALGWGGGDLLQVLVLGPKTSIEPTSAPENTLA